MAPGIVETPMDEIMEPTVLAGMLGPTIREEIVDNANNVSLLLEMTDLMELNTLASLSIPSRDRIKSVISDRSETLG